MIPAVAFLRVRRQFTDCSEFRVVVMDHTGPLHIQERTRKTLVGNIIFSYFMIDKVWKRAIQDWFIKYICFVEQFSLKVNTKKNELFFLQKHLTFCFAFGKIILTYGIARRVLVAIIEIEVEIIHVIVISKNTRSAFRFLLSAILTLWFSLLLFYTPQFPKTFIFSISL